MVKLNAADERVFSELRSMLVDVNGMLSPLTERVAPVDVIVRGLTERLAHYDPLVCIAVVGHPGSGKSTLINAILGCEALPHDTQYMLQVLPFSGGDVMLRKPAGKAIAINVDGVHAHLESEKDIWIEELGDRRLHGPLPLINPPHHYASNWCLVDTPTGTTGIRPNVSSVASRIHSPNVLTGDLIFYCVNAALIGDPATEAQVFGELIGDLEVPDSTLHRVVASTVFVLTMVDIVSDEEDCIDRVQRKIFDPPMKKVADLKVRFLDLLHETCGVEIDPSRQLIVTSGRNALLTRRMLEGSNSDGSSALVTGDDGVLAPAAVTGGPSMNHIYDYCEKIFGATFMQTIDTIPERDLQRMVAHHARFTQAEKSGSQELTTQLKLFDYNCVRHLMMGIGVTGAECVEQLVSALQLAKPALDVHVQENEEALEVLVKECDWVVRAADDLGHSIGEMVNTIIRLIDDELAKFWKRRIEELQYVLEHRELSWFWERQASTVVEMSSSLKKLEAFTAKYGVQRGLLQKKIRERDQMIADWKDAAARGERSSSPTHLLAGTAQFQNTTTSGLGGVVAEGSTTTTTVAGDPNTASNSITLAKYGVPSVANGGPDLGFMHLHAEGLLRQMNEEKEVYLLDFSTSFAHHVKDEYVLFLPDVIQKIDDVRTELVGKLAEEAHTPIEQTRIRTQLDFSLDSMVENFLTVHALEANERRLNNCLRDLPEHVAGAAVQISEQWELRRNPQGGDGGGGDSAASGEGFNGDRSLSQASISIIHNRLNKNEGGGGGTGAVHAQHIMASAAAAAATQAADAPAAAKDDEASLMSDYAALMRADQGSYTPADGFNIAEELRYLHEAWRLASVTVKMHQLTTYNLHDVKVATNQLSTTVLGYIGLYVSSLESAVLEQKELIQHCNDDALEVVKIYNELSPYIQRFENLLSNLQKSMLRDVDLAERLAKGDE